MRISDNYNYKQEDMSLVNNMIIHVVNTEDGRIEIQRYDSSKEYIDIPVVTAMLSEPDPMSDRYVTNKPVIYTFDDIVEYNNVDTKVSGDVILIVSNGSNIEKFVNINDTLYRIAPNVETRNGIIQLNNYEQGKYFFENEVAKVGIDSILLSLENQYAGSITRANSKIIKEDKSSLFYQSDELTSIGVEGTFTTISSSNSVLEIYTKEDVISIYDVLMSDFSYQDIYRRLYDDGNTKLIVDELGGIASDPSQQKLVFDVATYHFPIEISATFRYNDERYTDRDQKLGFVVVNKNTGQIEVEDTVSQIRTVDDDGNDVFTTTRRTINAGGQLTEQNIAGSGDIDLIVYPTNSTIDSVLHLFVRCESIDGLTLNY